MSLNTTNNTFEDSSEESLFNQNPKTFHKSYPGDFFEESNPDKPLFSNEQLETAEPGEVLLDNTFEDADIDKMLESNVVPLITDRDIKNFGEPTKSIVNPFAQESEIDSWRKLKAHEHAEGESIVGDNRMKIKHTLMFSSPLKNLMT